MKFFLVLAFVAAVSADVSHLRKYLPPFQDNNIGASFTNVDNLRQYLPPFGSSQQDQGFQSQASFQQPAFQQQAPELPTFQYQSPSQQSLYQQYQQQQQHRPQGTQYPKPAASFDDVNGYSYNVPQ